MYQTGFTIMFISFIQTFFTETKVKKYKSKKFNK